MTDTEDLVAWLREQIAAVAEDERWRASWNTPEAVEKYPHAARPGPADPAMVNQCEAHTALLDSYAEHIALPEYTPYVKGRRDKALHDVRLLALAYQHRPGYLEEWRP